MVLLPPAPQAATFAKIANITGRKTRFTKLTRLDQNRALNLESGHTFYGWNGKARNHGADSSPNSMTANSGLNAATAARPSSPARSSRENIDSKDHGGAHGPRRHENRDRLVSELRDRARKGEDLHGKSFAEMAEAFIEHADEMREVSEGQRRNYRQKWNLLKAHFNGVRVTNVDAKFLLHLRETRSKATAKNGAPVKPATLKKDIDFVRLVLRHAKSIEKCLDELPEFPSFRGEAWEVVPSPRPFLDHDQWVKLRKLGKARISEADLNPRSKRQRQELYWFLLISVGAALRVGEAYSLRWRDCELITLGDKDSTEAVHMRVLGKHSRGGKREEAYGMFGAVSAFKAMQAARPRRQARRPAVSGTQDGERNDRQIKQGVETGNHEREPKRDGEPAVPGRLVLTQGPPRGQIYGRDHGDHGDVPECGDGIKHQ